MSADLAYKPGLGAFVPPDVLTLAEVPAAPPVEKLEPTTRDKAWATTAALLVPPAGVIDVVSFMNDWPGAAALSTVSIVFSTVAVWRLLWGDYRGPRARLLERAYAPDMDPVILPDPFLVSLEQTADTERRTEAVKTERAKVATPGVVETRKWTRWGEHANPIKLVRENTQVSHMLYDQIATYRLQVQELEQQLLVHQKNKVAADQHRTPAQQANADALTHPSTAAAHQAVEQYLRVIEDVGCSHVQWVNALHQVLYLGQTYGPNHPRDSWDIVRTDEIIRLGNILLEAAARHPGTVDRRVRLFLRQAVGAAEMYKCGFTEITEIDRTSIIEIMEALEQLGSDRSWLS